jgi:dTDP-4-dehydrorhamnose reductase
MLVVTGGSGFLGSNLLSEAKSAGRDVVAVTHRDGIPGAVRSVPVDLAEPGAAERMIESLQPEWVVNCAALASVDQCETDRELAKLLNTEIPRSIARACNEAGVRFAHISTDSVFDGRRGRYREGDVTSPLNAYAQSKLEGERAVFDEMPNALVIRTNFIGLAPRPGAGLAEWIADRLEAGERIKGFTDVVFSPLVANQLARILFHMMDADLDGLYHVSSRDAISKYDLARAVAIALQLDASLIDKAKVFDAGLTANRPLDTSLDPAKVEQALGERMPSVQDAVDGFAKLRHSRNMPAAPETTQS